MWTPQWILLLGVMFIGIGVQLYVKQNGLKYGIVLLLASVTIIINGLDYYITYRLRKALKSGHYTIVEGTVHNLVPGDAGAHRSESWEVQSHGIEHYYEYSQSSYSAGFSRTVPYGGPIRTGLRVRIADVGGIIARLEVSP